MDIKAQGMQAFHVLKQTLQEFSHDNCSRMAAGLAYYTIFSLPPLLLIVITIAGAAFDPAQVEGRINEEITDVIGPEGAEQVRTMLDNVHERQGGLLTTLLGIAGLVVGATAAGAQLQTALNDAWGVEPDPRQGGIRNFLMKRVFSLLLIAGIALVLLASLVANSVIQMLDNSVSGIMPEGITRHLISWTNGTVTFVVVALMFAAVFKVLPDIKVAWRDVMVGAVFTTVLFLVGKFALEYHIGRSNPGSVFGAAGALAVILIWVYYSAMILLIGAEFTQVWARRHGKNIEPSKGAVRVAIRRQYEGEDPAEALQDARKLAKQVPQQEIPELRRSGAS